MKQYVYDLLCTLADRGVPFLDALLARLWRANWDNGLTQADAQSLLISVQNAVNNGAPLIASRRVTDLIAALDKELS